MASDAGFNVVITGVSIPSAKLQPYPAGSGNSTTGTMSLQPVVYWGVYAGIRRIPTSGFFLTAYTHLSDHK